MRWRVIDMGSVFFLFRFGWAVFDYRLTSVCGSPPSMAAVRRPGRAGQELLTSGPSVTRRRVAGSAACTAREGARGIARIPPSGHGWPVSGTPAARSAPRRFAPGAAPRVCSLWLLSLAQARESDSAARKADETAHGRESVIAQAPTIKKQNQNGSRLSPGRARAAETHASDQQIVGPTPTKNAELKS